MARQYGVQKVRLQEALSLLLAAEPLSYAAWTGEIAERFGCSTRTAQDAITVLRRGRWVERASPPPTLIQSDRRFYRVSERGRYVLEHPRGAMLLRIARKLFTSSPSSKVARHRRMLVGKYGSLDGALAFFERDLLGSPHEPRTLAEKIYALVDWDNPFSVAGLLEALAGVGFAEEDPR
jgi:hypothetical protein